MDVGAVLIELKEDRINEIDDWPNQMQTRKLEAIETLKAEGVSIESWFYLELEEKHYLIAYMRAEDMARAQEIGRNSQFDIDQVHKAFKQNWAKVHRATLLLDLDNQSDLST